MPKIDSVVCSVVEQIMLDLLYEVVFGEALDALRAKLFHIDAAADRLSRQLLTLSSSKALVVTFVQRKTDFAIVEQNTVFAKSVKEGSIGCDGSISKYYQRAE